MDFSINVGDIVDIGEVKDEKFKFLSNKTGIVTQILDSPIRRNRGYIVKVTGIDTEEKDWFINANELRKRKYEPLGVGEGAC